MTRYRDEDEPKTLPSWPHFATPPVEPFRGAYPVEPLNDELARAQHYNGRAWDGVERSFFRDLLLIAERNSQISRSIDSGSSFGQPLGFADRPPSPADTASGGVEGAIERLSQSRHDINWRVLKVRQEIREARRRAPFYTLSDLRAMSTASGSGAALLPANGSPLYLGQLFADTARTRAPLAHALLQGTLPPLGMAVIIPKATTGLAMSVQSADAASLGASSDEVTSSVVLPILTVAGFVDVSRQLFDRSELNVDAQISASLGAAFADILEHQVVSGSGASGQLLGILNASPATSNTFTSASPTASNNFGAIQKLLSDTSTAYGSPVNAVVMHPRRYRFMLDNSVVNQIGDGSGFNVERIIQTTGIPTNLGAGTNEDRVIALQLSESPIFLGPIRFNVDPDTLSANLQVRIYAYSYLTLAANRLPASVGIVGGTGLVSPTFV